MASSNVSSIVRDILAVFTDGLSIFARPKKKKKHQKSKSPPKMSVDELMLCDSLENRPKEIKAEYAQSIEKHGKRFEQGDSKAYSDLAQTLLILNTGLINFINHSLSSNLADLSKSRQNLLLLSETAATSTLRALSQLDLRLTSPASKATPDLANRSGKIPKQSTVRNAPLRPGPNPLLVRGGWVRSKSGSSVVSAATARKLIDHDGRYRRSQSSSASTTVTRASKDQRPVLCSADECYVQTSAESFEHLSHPGQKIINSKPVNNTFVPKIERVPSMVIVPADYFDVHTAGEEGTIVPPRPPKVPLHSRPNPKMRTRPISAATFMTASTKIGEIPEHEWPEKVATDEQRYLPLPYVIPPPMQSPQKRGKGFKFWKRGGRESIH